MTFDERNIMTAYQKELFNDWHTSSMPSEEILDELLLTIELSHRDLFLFIINKDSKDYDRYIRVIEVILAKNPVYASKR